MVFSQLLLLWKCKTALRCFPSVIICFVALFQRPGYSSEIILISSERREARRRLFHAAIRKVRDFAKISLAVYHKKYLV